jgi:FKBP-type peptidyl-prolyl cis-trans isomerase
MIKKFALLSCFLLLPVLAQAEEAAPEPAAAAPVVTPELQNKFSYAIGRDIGKSLQAIQDTLKMDLIKQGMDDSLANKAGNYSEAELQAAKTEMGKALQAKMLALEAATAEANLKAADAFLKKNGKRKGVKTTASGLQYEVLTAAKGPHPNETSIVTVHYRGTLENGTEFDSSYARNTPATFPLGQVIQGWTEGVQLMAKGAKYKFFVPPELAYAGRGAGERIGPNTMLIFEVELLSFEAPPAQ